MKSSTLKIFFLILILPYYSFVFSQQFVEYFPNALLKVKYGELENVDIDNDGDYDLIVSGLAGSDCRTYTYKNDGNGNLELFPSSGLAPIFHSSIATGDLDKDGNLDLFLSGFWESSSAYSCIYKNDGNGNFSVWQEYTTEPLYLGSSAIFDANGDGNVDLFYTGLVSGMLGKTKLYLNDGTGVLIDAPISIPGFQRGSIDVKDFDLDGDMDILMSGQMNPGTEKTILFENDGNANFTENSNVFEGVVDGNAMFTDIDMDNDLDIIVNGFTNGATFYKSLFYLNDGSGNFINVGNRGLDSLRVNSMAIADIDLDGDEDIFLSGTPETGNDKCSIYYNELGFFIKDTTFTPYGLAYGDALLFRLDDNCSPDLVYCGFGDSCETQTFSLKNINLSNYCPDSSSTIDHQLDQNPDLEYSVASNPFANQFRVTVEEKIRSYIMYDERGRIILKNDPNSDILDIDLTKFEDATYFLWIISSVTGRTATIKLLKIK